MLTSFSEFKFFQSIRVPVENSDDVRFLVESYDENSKLDYIDDAKLLDLSVTGLGFLSKSRLKTGSELLISLQFKRIHLDLNGTVVRAFTNCLNDDEIIYGVNFEEEDRNKVKKFLENFINSFSYERLKDCLIQMALTEKYARTSEAFEMFSLLLSIFKDMTRFGNRKDFLENMLEEVIRILNAQRASIFLINPDNNELEAVAALGTDPSLLRFEYRQGIAGSVFTTGVALNIDVHSANTLNRFANDFDKITGFETKSIICYPITNREDKIIGVIEVLNKRNEDRFTIEDEKIMKVMSLVFSSLFHDYMPMSEKSMIRRFSTPFDREYAMVGRSAMIQNLRKSIIRLKDINIPVLIEGEKGVGKLLLASIIHHEGLRGLNPLEILNCASFSEEQMHHKLFSHKKDGGALELNIGGSIIFSEIQFMSIDNQQKLVEVLKNNGLKESSISFDSRIIATSSNDLSELVKEGKFNIELYQYLSQSFVLVEPLSKRKDDLSDLINYFLRKECKRQGFLLKSFSPSVMDKFLDHDWPGNITELKQAVERAIVYNPKTHIVTNINSSVMPLFRESIKNRTIFNNVEHIDSDNLLLKEKVALIERKIITDEIKKCKGNKSLAAKKLGISREALRKKMIISKNVIEIQEGKKNYTMVETNDDNLKKAI
jgi:two-component system, NtrC family, response regulator HydG